MKYINSNADLHNKFLFILNKGMYDLLNTLPESQNYYCEFVEFKTGYKNYIIRTFDEWRIVQKIIERKDNIHGIIFMDIDIYLVLISSSRVRKLNLNIRGILFQPYLHFVEIGGGIVFYLKKVLKNYVLQKYALLMNFKIDKVFILNDKTGVAFLNKKFKNVFYNIPDPIENKPAEIDPGFSHEILKKYEIQRAKKNLLVFGSIDTRKNLISVIDALRLLPNQMKKEIHLIISGKMDAVVKEKYIEHIEKYKDEISIAYNDDFVKGAEREIIFENCDLVLMPYINFYSASSVVGHAICYNKNIIAPKKGLLAKIVRSNRLGINVDPNNVSEIKDAIIELLNYSGKYKYDGQALIEEYDPSNFSKSILMDN
ncbi:MAG: glycosyltransferase [Ginsengibacter sp.]